MFYRIINILILLGILSRGLLPGQNLPYACRGEKDSYAVSGLDNSVFHWEIINGRGDPLSSSLIQFQGEDTILVDWNVPPGKYQIQVTEYSHIEFGGNQFECIGIPNISFIQVEENVVDIGNYSSQCEGEEILLKPSSNFKSYLWSDSTLNSSLSVSNSGNYWLQAIDEFGCTGTDTAFVQFYPSPIVDLGEDIGLCGLEEVMLDPGYYTDYLWDINGEYYTQSWLDIKAGRSTIYLTVTDEYGCKGSDTLEVLDCNYDYIFKNIPNVFTPNGDGYYDNWVILKDLEQIFPNVSVELFDRWGRLVWRSDHYQNDFVGNDLQGRELPIEGYHYVLNLNMPGVAPATGSVSIFR